MQKSEMDRIKRNNEIEEFIYRNESDRFIPPFALKTIKRDDYPWEEEYVGNIPKITKEYFRCRGNMNHPEQVKISKEGKPTYHHDCGGIESHSLPMKNSQEFVYPIFINLLNYIQRITEKKVVITCAHRCPKHNLYADSSDTYQRSKHQVGAEVDFYVEGLEFHPEKVLEIIKQFYQEFSSHLGSEWHKFSYNREKEQLFNKEIAIRISRENQNRDFDNEHPYPYLTIELKYDTQNERAVQYQWQEALSGYVRW
jgi:hypothetical protein